MHFYCKSKKTVDIGLPEPDAVAPIEIVQTMDRDSYETRKSQRQIERKRRSKSSILNPLNYMNTGVPIFPNGSDNLSEKKRMIEIINTCGFDSIMSIFSCLYFDYDAFRSMVDKNVSSELSHLLQLMYQQQRIEQSLEQIRYKMLKTILANTSFLAETSNLIHINAGTTLNYMFTRIFSNGNDFIASKTEMAKCMSCGHQSKTICCQINVILDDFDLQHVENSIEANSNRQCRNCTNNISKIDIEYNAIVAIDTEQIHYGSENIYLCRIDDITKTIRLNQMEYELFGVIEHQSNPQHFISHVKRQSNEWFTYDDLVGRQFDCNVKDVIAVHMIFYKKKPFGKRKHILYFKLYLFLF